MIELGKDRADRKLHKGDIILKYDQYYDLVGGVVMRRTPKTLNFIPLVHSAIAESVASGNSPLWYCRVIDDDVFNVILSTPEGLTQREKDALEKVKEILNNKDGNTAS